jgi:hypothetical protein
VSYTSVTLIYQSVAREDKLMALVVKYLQGSVQVSVVCNLK